MAHKRLLCIAPAHVDTDALLCDTMPDWEICSVTSLAEAGRELRNSHYLVGLLMHEREQQRVSIHMRGGDAQQAFVCHLSSM